MNIKHYFQDASRNLRTAKLNAILAVLGVLVGVGAVVAMVSTSQLATRAALSQFKNLNIHLLSASFYLKKMDDGNTEDEPLTPNQLEDIQRQLPEIQDYSAVISLYSGVSFQTERIGQRAIATDAALQRILNVPLQSGRFLSPLDKTQPFAVIGARVAQKIQQRSGQPALGQIIQLSDQLFTVIGVAKPWPNNPFFNWRIDNSAFISLENAVLIQKDPEINLVLMQLKTGSDISSVKKRFKKQLKQRLPNAEIYLRSAEQTLQSMQKQSRIFTLLLGIVAGISLLVGGIGVMNIMLVSVAKRRQEIGIRRALGARQRDIQALFLAESVLLTGMGGFFGIALGTVATWVISHFAHWHFALSFSAALAGLLVAALTGIGFGFYPARAAAKLDPIQCIRNV